MWKWRWLSWAPPSLSPYGLCGRRATLNLNLENMGRSYTETTSRQNTSWKHQNFAISLTKPQDKHIWEHPNFALSLTSSTTCGLAASSHQECGGRCPAQRWGAERGMEGRWSAGWVCADLLLSWPAACCGQCPHSTWCPAPHSGPTGCLRRSVSQSPGGGGSRMNRAWWWAVCILTRSLKGRRE